MKRALLMIAIPCGLALLLTGIRLFHLGPFSIHTGDNLLLAHVSFTNGPNFFVIGHRNESAGEPYTVNLFKVDQYDHEYSQRRSSALPRLFVGVCGSAVHCILVSTFQERRTRIVLRFN